MDATESSNDHPDAVVTPDADGRIMRPPEEDVVVAGVTEAAGPPDIESTSEATDSSYTAHMEDGDDESDAVRPAGGGQ